MKDNGFELSQEKTCLMFFNNRENLKSLPQTELDGQLLNYKQNTKLLLFFFFVVFFFFWGGGGGI